MLWWMCNTPTSFLVHLSNEYSVKSFALTFIEKIAGSFSNITNDEFVQLFGDCTLSDAVCIGLTFVGLPPRFCVAMAPVHNTTS